jgi:hypothetical protein
VGALGSAARGVLGRVEGRTVGLVLTVMFVTSFCLGVLSMPVRAQGCDCGTMGALMRSLGERVVSGIALPLDTTIKEAASFTSTNVREDLSALRETVLLMKDQVVDAIRAADKNQGLRLTERTYEPGSQPKTLCGDDALGASIMLGGKTSTYAHTDILDRVLERSKRFMRPLDYLNDLSGEGAPTPTTVLGLGLSSGPRTYSLEETGSAAKLLESLSNPLPPPVLSEAKQKNPAGKNYMAAKNDYELHLSIYQAALSRGVVDRAPTLEHLSDWARSKWELMGGTGDPPGLTDGKLSQETLMWYLANMRLASANWHEEGLAALPEAGLLREMASMQAVNLELLRRQNEILRDMLNILSLSGLRSLESDKRPALLELYKSAEAVVGNQ